MFTNLNGIATYACDTVGCRAWHKQPLLRPKPAGWQERGPWLSCPECAADTNPNRPLRAASSCSGSRGSEPAGQDTVAHLLLPTGPCRTSRAIDRVLLAISLSACAALVIVIVWAHVTRDS